MFHRKLTASDGTALALYRWVPAGGGSAHPPLLLVPELGFGRETFDFGDGGLAAYLVERGREVYVIELRGQGQSAAPPGWRLRDLVERDLPEAVAAIRASRPGPIDLVAHGYSGTLALAAAVRELDGAVGRVIALSTPAVPEVPNSTAEAFLAGGGKLASLAGDPAGARAFDLLFARGANIAPPRHALLRSTAVSDLSPAAAADLLGWMRTGDLALADASTVQARLARYTRPTLLVLPIGDAFAHPEHASALRDLSRAPIVPLLLNRRDWMAEDYTHLSMLAGSGAPADVFAPALAFLDGKAPVAGGGAGASR